MFQPLAIPATAISDRARLRSYPIRFAGGHFPGPTKNGETDAHGGHQQKHHPQTDLQAKPAPGNRFADGQSRPFRSVLSSESQAPATGRINAAILATHWFR